MQSKASSSVRARRSWIVRAACCATMFAGTVLAGSTIGAAAQEAGAKPAQNPTQKPAEPATTPTPGGSQNRDTAGIVEEQDLLRRQLQRLRRTMEGLIPRLEKEGRPRALELLKDGLKLLEERGEDTKHLTIEELMDSARQGVQSGQAVQSLESQEAVIHSLERLVAILLDRESMENLQTSLEELKAIRAEIEGLKTREQKLQQDTSKLRDDSKSETQKALEDRLRELASEQRKLLEQNEQMSRASGSAALEQIERELQNLLAREHVDAGVLESWQPDTARDMNAVTPALDEARRAAARAERMREAAAELRDAAKTARAAQAPEDTNTAAGDLDNAADREERRNRASGDASSERSAKALREGANELRQEPEIGRASCRERV